MNIQALAKSARLYARSEFLVTEIQMKTYARKFVLTSLAVLAAIMGLAFINMAAFAYLQSIWGPVWTPLLVGLANFILAALAWLAAVLTHSSSDLAMAKELRKLSGNALEAEFQSSHSVGGSHGGANDTTIVRLLIPAVVSIIGAMRRRKASGKT
jgi:hypothetical protein